MKLLHIIRSADARGGGPIEVVRQFATAHQEQGHHIEILTLDAPGSHRLGDLPGVVHGIGSNSYGYGYTPALRPWLREHEARFDAIIVHGLWQFHGRGTRKALQGTGTPYFVYPHGMLDPWFRKAYRLKHLKKVIYWRLVENRVLRDAHSVLFTCEEERRLAQKTFRPYRCVERVAPLGIKAPPGSPEKQRTAFFERYPEFRGKQFLLFLGRLHPKKGCDLLIRAFGELHKRGTVKPEQKLLLAGPCAEASYLAELQRLASELCPPGSVRFPGMLTGDLKWGALRSAEAFVLPSHQENFGIAVVESLACGVAVLISNKVNIWREIEEDESGLVGRDDVDGTCDLLARWQGFTSIQRELMQTNARRSFEQRFAIQQAARTLIRILEERRE